MARYAGNHEDRWDARVVNTVSDMEVRREKKIDTKEVGGE